MPTQMVWKQLAQRHLTSTADVVLYRPPLDSITTFVKVMIVCNTTGSATTYSVWVNPGSTTTGDSYAIIKNIPLAATASDQRIYPDDSGMILKGTSAALIVKAGAANSVTVTLYGVEMQET